MNQCTSHLPLAFVLAATPKTMCSDRQGLISQRLPSELRSGPLVFTIYLHSAPVIAMGTEELQATHQGREAEESDK